MIGRLGALLLGVALLAGCTGQGVQTPLSMIRGLIAEKVRPILVADLRAALGLLQLARAEKLLPVGDPAAPCLEGLAVRQEALAKVLVPVEGGLLVVDAVSTYVLTKSLESLSQETRTACGAFLFWVESRLGKAVLPGGGLLP